MFQTTNQHMCSFLSQQKTPWPRSWRARCHVQIHRVFRNGVAKEDQGSPPMSVFTCADGQRVPEKTARFLLSLWFWGSLSIVASQIDLNFAYDEL
jgi:hypothetical protein